MGRERITLTILAVPDKYRTLDRPDEDGTILAVVHIHGCRMIEQVPAANRSGEARKRRGVSAALPQPAPSLPSPLQRRINRIYTTTNDAKSSTFPLVKIGWDAGCFLHMHFRVVSAGTKHSTVAGRTGEGLHFAVLQPLECKHFPVNISRHLPHCLPL